VFTAFGTSVYKISDNDTDIDIFSIYKNLGKMELILDLTNDNDYRKLLQTGKGILDDYVKNNE